MVSSGSSRLQLLLLFSVQLLGLIGATSSSDNSSTFFPPHLCNWKSDSMSQLCREASNESLEMVFAQARVTLGKKSLPMLNPFFPSLPEDACTRKSFGKRYGSHVLCANMKPDPASPCVFFSYGIEKDYTFDVDLSEAWNCSGHLLDPTVKYPEKITDKLTFYHMAAPLLDDYKDFVDDFSSVGQGNVKLQPLPPHWHAMSMVKLLHHVKMPRVHVIKADCEGCEYAIASEVSQHRPRFFSAVDQFEIEIHLGQMWMKTPLHLHFLGLLFHMLFREGLYLTEMQFATVNPRDRRNGCIPQLKAVGWPECFKIAHMYTFARLPPPIVPHQDAAAQQDAMS